MRLAAFLLFFIGAAHPACALDPHSIIDLWPEGKTPGPLSIVNGEERDLTKDTDRLIAGERIIKLGHVSKPQAHIFLPPAEKANGTAVVICPGGGFHILAWDLEGTEVAEWLNGIGIAAIVVKYRVPTARHGDELVEGLPKRVLGPAMDAQRGLSITRANAEKWNVDPDHVGILGFSAGGVTAVAAALQNGDRLYAGIDETDEASCRADFAMPIYPGFLAENDGSLKEYLKVTKETPPMFFAHAADDRVTCLSSTALFVALKQADVHADLHIYAKGGHGYGLRPTDNPVTHWPKRAEEWMRSMQLLGSTELGDRFVVAWRNGKPLPSLLALESDANLEEAYAIQRDWVMRTLGDPGIGGIKGGIVTPAGQKRLGVKEPIGAILRASGRLEAKSKPTISLKQFPNLKLETEIGFVVGKKIDRPITDLDAFKKHIKAIVPIIELPAGESKMANDAPNPIDLAALNVFSSGYIVGEPADPESLDPRALKLVFEKDGTQLHEASAADNWTGPWETAHWLANFAQRQGVDLQPNHVILCGALGKIHLAEKGSYRYNAGALGHIEFTIK